MIHSDDGGYLESALTRETASRETASTTVQVGNFINFSTVILFHLFNHAWLCKTYSHWSKFTSASTTKKSLKQVDTKRCRLSLLTNSALVYEPKCGGVGEWRGLSQWVQLYTRAKINFGDLTPSIFNLWYKAYFMKMQRDLTSLTDGREFCEG